MVPTPFGRYLLLELLAEGGMAQVFRAVLRDLSGFEKVVALKRIRRELCEDPEFISRFIDEARIASTLSHANISQVFDFGQVEGDYFLAMELVDGPDLGTLLQACAGQRQPLPIPTATFIAAEVARGLGAAHARLPSPVVHRDVSPQNVLLSRSGEVKVVDFGIALAAEKALRTRTGMVLGKCRYMAPEQATGQLLDARTDIFACGALLHELLSGVPLFDGASTEQVIEQLLRGPVPLASSRNPEVPPELDEVLARCLDRDPGGRPADGGALARELEALLHRMAPEFSRDDLAALIRATVPPRSAAGLEAVPTCPDPGGLGMAPTQPLEDSVAPGPASSPVAVEAAPGSATESLPAPPSWAPPAVVVDPDAPGPGPEPGRSWRARRQLLAAALLAGAALLGSCLGVSLRWWQQRPPRRALAAGGSLDQQGFRLRLEEVSRLQRALLVRLHLSPAPAAAATQIELGGASPRFRVGRPTPAGIEWRLGFTEAARPAALHLEAPGRLRLRLDLLEDR